jgi:hypothetical protein
MEDKQNLPPMEYQKFELPPRKGKGKRQVKAKGGRGEDETVPLLVPPTVTPSPPPANLRDVLWGM